jgi:hypothetical protein
MKPGGIWLCPRCQQAWLERHPVQWVCSNCGFYLVLTRKGKQNDDDVQPVQLDLPPDASTYGLCDPDDSGPLFVA